MAAALEEAAGSAVGAAVLAAFPVGAVVPIDHPAQAALVDTVIIIPEEAIVHLLRLGLITIVMFIMAAVTAREAGVLALFSVSFSQ